MSNKLHDDGNGSNAFSSVIIMRNKDPFSVINSMVLCCKSCFPKLKHQRLWGYIFKKLFEHYNFCHKWLLSFFWNISWKDIEQTPLIICLEWTAEYSLCRFIAHCFPSKKLVIWIWNIQTEQHINYLKKTSWELWSFDKNECLKYGLNYSKTFMAVASIPLMPVESKITKDVLFIGADKDRKEKILRIKNILDNFGISNQIQIISYQENSNFYSKPMTYETILYECQKARAILDVPLEGQYGITQREMEALFFKKKLITTNPFAKERDYYHPNNIYILDFFKDLDDIIEFIYLPLVPISEKIVYSYHIDSWLQRFLKE